VFDHTISRILVRERPTRFASAEGASPVEPMEELEMSAWAKCQSVSWRMLSAAAEAISHRWIRKKGRKKRTVGDVAEDLVRRQDLADIAREELALLGERGAARNRVDLEEVRLEEVVDRDRQLLVRGELAGLEGGEDGGSAVHDD
jgi:hypothetical protein